jgi:hypothetical protein
MAAPLRCDLILEHDAGEARARIALHGALDVLRTAESGVAVPNDRDGYGTADVAPLIDQLAVGDETGVRHADSRRRDRKAAHERHLEAGVVDQPRRHRIVTPRHDDQSRAAESLAEPLGAGDG